MLKFLQYRNCTIIVANKAYVVVVVVVPRAPLGILRKIYILLCLKRTWERGSHLKNSIYGNSNNNNNNNKM